MQRELRTKIETVTEGMESMLGAMREVARKTNREIHIPYENTEVFLQTLRKGLVIAPADENFLVQINNALCSKNLDLNQTYLL